MDFVFSPGIYVIGILLLCVLLSSNVWRTNLEVAAVFAVSIAASLWYSCTYDYQSQGRYLLPAVAVLITVFGESGRFRLILPFTLVTIFCLMRFMQAFT